MTMDDEQADRPDASSTGRLDASVAVSIAVKTPQLPTEIALVLVAVEVQIRLVALPVFL